MREVRVGLLPAVEEVVDELSVAWLLFESGSIPVTIIVFTLLKATLSRTDEGK